MKRQSSKIRFYLWHKLLLALGAALVILAVSLSFSVTHFLKNLGDVIGLKSREVLATQTERFLATVIDGQGETIDLQLYQARTSAIHGARAIAASIGQGKRPTGQFLKDLLKNAGAFSTTAFYLSADGEVLFYPDSEGIDLDHFHSEHHIAPLGPQWGAPHENEFSLQYDRVIDVVAPVNVDGKVQGYLGISVSIIKLIAQFNHKQTIRGSYTFVLDSNSGLLSGPPHATFDLTPKNQRNSATREIIDLSATENEQLLEVVEDMTTGNTAVQQLELNSNHKYIAYRPLSQIEWSLGLAVPVRLATVASEQIVNIIKDTGELAVTRLIVAILFFSGVTLLVIGLITRRMTRPLLTMAEIADQISHGELDKTINVSSNDEIGELALAFNSMSHQLNEYIGSLRSQQRELLESQERYKILFQNSPISLWEEDFSRVKRYVDDLKNKEGLPLKDIFHKQPETLLHCAKLVRIVDVNQATMDLYGAKSKSELLGNLPKILPNEALDVLRDEILSMENKEVFEQECTNTTLDGRTLTISVKCLVPPGYEDSWSKVFVAIGDITERKNTEEEKRRLEAQLRQSYKMEAIGTLAGGIAHDFNNILSAILGYSELIKLANQLKEKEQHYNNQVLTAATRAKELVEQILSFSRQTEQEPSQVVLKDVLVEALKLLRASLPSTIDIRQEIKTDGIIWANTTQIHQVIMNLCTNAGHAMQAGGGILRVKLEEKESDLTSLSSEEHRGTSSLVVLTVEDTGHGMPAERIDRIFDPYYTTKGRQRGTGMGLAVVHGIVQTYSGFIEVESQVGKGTRFQVHFPSVDGGQKADKQKNHKNVLFGSEAILFVDDESVLAELGESALNELGYVVTAKTSAFDALDEVKKDPSKFDLVITDMTMPEMTGDKLAEEINSMNPELPILIYSGYSERLHLKLDLDVIAGVFSKPINLLELSQIVRSTLDKKRVS